MLSLDPPLHELAVLPPKLKRDIVALIFVLMTLPQCASLLVLMAYVLLGLFKALAGRTVAHIFSRVGPGLTYEFAPTPTAHYSHYRKQLVGEFLRLFCINSFILVLAYYSMPHPWLKGLLILAKSIIASKLVGIYASGSTTYVSVVASPQQPSLLGPTVSTTTNTEAVPHTHSSSVANMLVGAGVVLFTEKYLKHWVLHMSGPTLARNVAAFVKGASQAGQDPLELTAAAWHNSPAVHAGMVLHYASGLVGPEPDPLVIRLLGKLLSLDNELALKLAGGLREAALVLNFAYLVLCIHVISLTVAPFLQNFFMLKDYSKTLDHLSTLTPDVPYTGYKKTAVPSNILRDMSTDSLIVTNVEHTNLASSASASPHHELAVAPAVAGSALALQHDFTSSAAAENFKTFCMAPPTSRTVVPSTRNQHSRTVVDRKRSNSVATTSTTILDKYFVISVQPIWSWLAAMKVLLSSPGFLRGAPSKSRVSQAVYSVPAASLHVKLASVEVGSTHVLLRELGLATLQHKLDNLRVVVNGLEWEMFDCLIADDETRYVRVNGLATGREVELHLFVRDELVHHSTHHTRPCKADTTDPGQYSSVDYLQSSLKATTDGINDAKATLKRWKRDENKRVADIRKQLDIIKAKADKLSSSQDSEARAHGKAKGLQNIIAQLGHEIDELEHSIAVLKESNGETEQAFSAEERSLQSAILKLEEINNNHEKKMAQFRGLVKVAEDEKLAMEQKLAKLRAKMQAKADGLQALHVEMKGIKKTMTARIQKRQRKVHDRFEAVIPQIVEATEAFREA